MRVVLDHITKRFSDVTAVSEFNATLEDGELVSLLGPSGCDKSTLLNMLSGILPVSSGKIYFDDQDVTSMPPEKRGIGLVFQNYALYPHMTVMGNICFPLEISGTPKAEAKKRAEELLRVVGLSDKAASYPSQLSGGQKQRVAIARALATKPRYLLCDEATSALDPNTTRSILELLREINKTLGVTIIVITHEMKVIDQICDRVAVIDKSCIAEEGRVADVFTSPKSDIARELVLPQERPVLEPTTGGRKVRIIFNGENTQKPVISEMILACRVPVNVLFADTKSVEGAAYGHMIFELPNDEHDAEKVISWLKNSGLTWKEER